MINKDTFCISPWVELRINSDGSLNFCDYAKRIDLIASENINYSTVDEYFQNGTSINHARSLIDAGKSHTRCTHCLADECVTDIGFRHRHNLKAGIFPGKDFEQSLAETEHRYRKDKPMFYHVSFSNSCNMACVMCEPFNSSLLARDMKRANLIASSRGHDWTTGPAWDNFLDHLLNNPNIMCLHIMGGEPLYHKRFQELLEFLVEHNHTDFNFTFVTNGSVYNARLAELLEHFTGVQIEISIETFDRANDYVRYPSNTPEITENIKQWLQHRSDSFDVVIRTVPQLLTIESYHTVLDFCLEHGVVVDSNILNTPDYFHASLAPDHVKQKVTEQLLPYTQLDTTGVENINVRNKSRLNSVVAANAQFVLNIINVDAENKQDKQARMMDYLTKLDSVRNVDCKDYFPWIQQ